MITVNGNTIGNNHFPDGSLMLLDFPEVSGTVTISWKYENDGELFTLICAVKHIRNTWGTDVDGIQLVLPYIPHARMDRTKSNTEVFTLKYFCEVINSLNFEKVFVLDPHSYVSEALLDRLIKLDVENFIKYVIDDVEGKDIDGGKSYGGSTIIYFPDAGAMKRYKCLDVFTGRRMIYGEKERDWKTGKITGLSIYSDVGTPLTEFGEKPLKDGVVLMIDDIMSYGGTLAYSADALKNLGASAIYAYVSHLENSVLDEEKGTFIKRLNGGVVDELFTTNSIFKYVNPRIEVYEGF